ncbi:Hsp90 cochaperone shq1 [Desmophyllum pertusum]|uniref:Hsp90 cochaperone shq1 n=1 Tax=Desmophyllum pertusum TaxID=174260 RepID=A0A9W9ZD14_9CNID|nr:Hsp90 cochaperone shq1 [Desmophyllum pertusum]
MWTNLKWTHLKWTHLKWTHQKWTHQKWTHQKWTHQKWTHQKWTHQKWTHQKWTHQKWTHQKWTHQKWTHQKWTHKSGRTKSGRTKSGRTKSGRTKSGRTKSGRTKVDQPKVDAPVIERSEHISDSPPVVLITNTTDISLSGTKYGFANQKSGIYKGREAELHELSEITDPDSMTLSERREARLAAEDTKFDEEYYLADYFNEDQIQHLLDYKPPWYTECLQCRENLSQDKTEHSSQTEETTVQFTDEEKDQLRRLPNKDYILENNEKERQ